MTVPPPQVREPTELEALREGLEAARVLQLDVAGAEAVLAEADARHGLTDDAYTLAVVGGTGVGKSSLVNALAGRTVSPAGARRPTTGRPVAWLPRDLDEALAPLLRHLDVEVAAAGQPWTAPVIVLDTPDIDSVDASHRAAVESILPKVDVVAWVVDPEKYADAVLHDAFLRTWLARLDRQIVVLNKVDRLAPEAVETVVADLRAVIGRELPELLARPPTVVAASAERGASGVTELREWIAGAAEAKAIVTARRRAAARAALAELAAFAGVGSGSVGGIVPAAARREAIAEAADEVLRIVDLPGVERRAVAATRAGARRRGTGPMGILTSGAQRALGLGGQGVDPWRYLSEWRGRGVLARATERLRRVVVEALPGLPPALRPAYAAAAEGSDTEARLAAAVEAAIARQPPQAFPTSRLWPLLGLVQTANVLVLAFAAAWIVIWILARPPVATYDLPVLGPVPAPLLLLAVGLVIGYVAARALGLHAGWLGRRWARRLGSEIRTSVGEAVERDAFPAVDRLDAARAALAGAWSRARLP